MPLY
jgi:hypothetical protein